MPPTTFTAFRPERELQRKIEGRVAMKPKKIDIGIGISFASTGTIMGTLFGKAIL